MHKIIIKLIVSTISFANPNLISLRTVEIKLTTRTPSSKICQQ